MLFEVHQPLRVNRNFHLDLAARQQVTEYNLYGLYFDHRINREIFNRIAERCYMPANKILLEQIDQFKAEKREFKVSFSISGIFIEQCERWNSDLLDSFKQLANSQCVEFLDQTYYHSLASLYDPDWSEFIEQVEMHRQLMSDVFCYTPKIFENTECLYSNNIAKRAEELGFEAIVTEGTERILGWRSPNFVYKAKDASIKVLLRNYRLSDDVGFRFASPQWDQWPLSADKYAAWLARIPEPIIVIFLDYETFGEHYWPESGILEFLRWLPIEVAKLDNLLWSTPSEVIHRHMPVDEIDVPPDRTISWADSERDTGAWLGNPQQSFSFNIVKDLGPLIREINNEKLLETWRYLQTSDHFYYMYMKGGESGVVHDTFNPYGNPTVAFVTYIGILSDFQTRCQLEMKKPEFKYKRLLRRLPQERGFKFFYKFACPTGLTACSLEEFHSILKKISAESIVFHMYRGDFERWLLQVVGDETLAARTAKLSKEKMRGESLRNDLLEIIDERIKELRKLGSDS